MTSGLDLEECCALIGESAGVVFRALDGLGHEAVRFWTGASDAGSLPAAADTDVLESAIMAELTSSVVPMNGCGVVFAPGLIRDRDLIMQWFRHDSHGRIRRLSLDFNPSSERFYDYTRMGWFRVPRDEGRPTIVGPYVDIHGSDFYVMTFAIPLTSNGRFLGIAGADLALVEVERELTSPLRGLDVEALLITEEGRILAANTPSWIPGNLMPRNPDRPIREAKVPNTSAEWKVVLLGDTM
ncbi:cache domain-containing protein [Nonomuraea sp. NPDC005650]|uniref:cache domain-containing protein n=1 Tax=Nonomuraea sp. NPDC005650 TaxID=3157045 RepID=UPI0033A0AEE8